MHRNESCKVVIIVPGGIGIGRFNDGVPILENIIHGMAQKHNVTVFSLVATSPKYAPKDFKLYHSGFKNTSPSFIKLCGLIFAIGWFILRNRVAVFHGFWSFPCGFLAVLFAKMTRSKSIVSIQGGDLVDFPDIQYGGSQRCFRRNLIKWTLKSSQINTVESKYMLTQLQKYRPGTKVNLVYYGVDPSLFSPNERKISSPTRFMHIANQNLVKDQETLLKAFALITKEVKGTLTIIGEDFLDGKIEKLADLLEIEQEVRFLGYQPQDSIAQYLSDAHIMLHTSRHESTAMVVVEAMAAGVLVCGTSVGIIADLAPKHCVAVPVQAYEELALETLALIYDSERMDLMRMNAKSWTQKNSLESTIKHFCTLYQR